MKCGKETVGNQVFCQACLDVMAAYPVKPGTPIQILPRPARSQEKKAGNRQQELSEKEQIQLYRKIIRWLTVTIGVLCAVLCFLVVLLLLTLEGRTIADFFIGTI